MKGYVLIFVVNFLMINHLTYAVYLKDRDGKSNPKIAKKSPWSFAQGNIRPEVMGYNGLLVYVVGHKNKNISKCLYKRTDEAQKEDMTEPSEIVITWSPTPSMME